MAILVVAVAMITWGARLTWIEGVVRARLQGFGGDFAAMMWDPHWWDGTGIVYGPVFVIERWLVNWAPGLFRLDTFWFANFVLVGVAFLCCVMAARLTSLLGLLCLGLWLSSWYLFYALSVTANPEFLEMALLSVSWLAVTRYRSTTACVSVVVAALTKIMPAIFVPPLLFLPPSRKAVLISGSVALLLALAVGIGQRMTPGEALVASLLPFLYHPSGAAALTDLGLIVPSSSQFVGLGSALARALSLGDSHASLGTIRLIVSAVTVVILLVATTLSALLLRNRAVERLCALGLVYALFFALQPIANPQPHPHTFIFLLPVWVAIVGTLAHDHHALRRVSAGAAALAVYTVISVPGVPQYFDRFLGTTVAHSAPFTDYIWANLILVAGVAVYAASRLLEARKVPYPQAIAVGPGSDYPMGASSRSLPPVAHSGAASSDSADHTRESSRT